MYLKYLIYVIRHKWFVGQECFKRCLYWRGIVHDWSKFLPGEFLPYAQYFYGEKYPSIYEYHGDHRNFALNSGYYKEAVERAFDRAWLAHQHRNPHHWQHWVLREDSGATKVLPMPYRCAMEMVCDWIGAGRAIHRVTPDPNDPCKEARQWYLKNKDKILLHDETRRDVEIELCMWKEKANAEAPNHA